MGNQEGEMCIRDRFLDDAMSNRGHIWNKTIPLLGKHAFMGSGANTYMFEVPQEDYISQNYVYGANSYDVKAHSLSLIHI